MTDTTLRIGVMRVKRIEGHMAQALHHFGNAQRELEMLVKLLEAQATETADLIDRLKAAGAL